MCNIKNWIKKSILLSLIASCSGCVTLLPSGNEASNSNWKSYDHVESTLKKIKPKETTIKDLRKLGIDFKTTPNLKTLTYLDVMERFKLDSTLFNEINLPDGLEEALNMHEKCIAYELTIKRTNKKRVGSFWKDILSFEQVTKSEGWSFQALIVIVDKTVVYVLYSGSPRVERMESHKKPLGPFQGVEAGTLMDLKDAF
tara:strand:- start:2283 stop:2879 length:597 start_codon:yes stop_codon:yes gene_type:complete